MPNRISLVVPLRAFVSGKTRLAPALAIDERRRIAEACARSVLCSATAARVERVVVCEDDDTERWALAIGANAARVATTGLNESLDAARLAETCTADTVVIAHGDLPLADRLVDDVLEIASTNASCDVLIVTDRHEDGTNVLVLPRRRLGDWRFAYGPGSKDRHLAEAARLGLRVRALTHPRLSVDLDTVDDLALPAVAAFVDMVLRPDPDTVGTGSETMTNETGSDR